MARVLLIEDSRRLRTYVKDGLIQAGFAVDQAEDGEEGLWLAGSNDYDAIILDLMLPKMDGLTVLDRLRSEGRKTHILILTAKDTVEDRVIGLDKGADDYLVKPFAFEELLARVQALVRRSYGIKSPVIDIGGLEIDIAKRSVERQGKAIDLTAREFALLEYLALRKGQVVSRKEIEDHLYDDGAELTSNVVDSHIYRLRKKIEIPGGPALIQTRRGMGYILEEPGA
jgi:DNA-binding response OmpR family regulator